MAFDTTYEKDDVKEINEVVRSTVNVLDDFDYNLYAIITAVIEVYMGCMELLDPPDNNVNAHVFLVLGMDEANSLQENGMDEIIVDVPNEVVKEDDD